MEKRAGGVLFAPGPKQHRQERSGLCPDSPAGTKKYDGMTLAIATNPKTACRARFQGLNNSKSKRLARKHTCLFTNTTRPATTTTPSPAIPSLQNQLHHHPPSPATRRRPQPPSSPHPQQHRNRPCRKEQPALRTARRRSSTLGIPSPALSVRARSPHPTTLSSSPLTRRAAADTQKKDLNLLAAEGGHFSLIKAMHLADLITEMNGTHLYPSPILPQAPN